MLPNRVALLSYRMTGLGPRWFIRRRASRARRRLNRGDDDFVVDGVAPVSAEPAPIVRAARQFGMPLLRLGGAVTVLVLVGRQVGATPFRDGLGAVTWPAVLAGVALTLLTTLCSAWRWRLVAAGLGVAISQASAVGACYRSQFLNSVLPGGILGDVHRGVAQGRHVGHLGCGLRSVAWERLCGQVVQAMVSAVVLLTIPSPVRPALPYLGAGLAGAVGGVGLMLYVAARRGRRWPAITARAVQDLRRGVLARGVWPKLLLASTIVVAGHTTIFVVAARAAESTAPLAELVALLMLVQMAMVIPLSVGGWGVREGAAAWVFTAAGLGAAAAVTVTTVYAAVALVAVSPGAVLLGRDTARRAHGRRAAAEVTRPLRSQAEPTHA